MEKKEGVDKAETRQVIVLLTREEYDLVKECAESRRLSMLDLMRELLSEAIKKEFSHE